MRLGRLESQAAVVVRRRQRHAVQAVRAEQHLAGRLRARSRLSRRGKRAHRPAAQLESCRRGRDRDDGQGARHRALRRDQVHDRHRLLRRLDHAAAARVAVSRSARRHPAFVHVSGFVFHWHGGRRLRDARQLLRIAGIRGADEGADAGAGRSEESGDRRAHGRKGVPRMGDVVRQLEQSWRVHASAHEQADQQLSICWTARSTTPRKIPTACAARFPSTRSRPGAPCPARASRAGRTTTPASSTG